MAQSGDTPLRILILASGDLWAGAEAVVYQLARGLQEYTPTQVSAVYLNEGRLADLSRLAGVSTNTLDERLHGFASLVRQFAGLARKINPHIIHSHRYKENILAAMVSPFAGYPRLVTTVHGMSEVQGSPRARTFSFVNNLLMKNVFTKVVAVSNDLQERLTLRNGVPKQKLTRIYNGMDLADHNAVSPGRQGVYTVGSAGRLVPVKDYDLMVDIAHAVCGNRRDVRFVLAGDGPELEHIRERVHAYGLDDRFELLGHVSDTGAFYSRLDLYINTSRHEGIPMTIL